jgi:general secretion pathway protein A
MYEQFFGLEEEPFRLTPDPRYLYLSSKHAEALAHLRLGLTESSGFVCITGEIGAGKTTLLRAFLAELGPDVTAAYTFVPPLSAVELLLRICRDFGVKPASERQSDIVDALHAFLLEQRLKGRICVVVLDEAQALSIELLEQVRLLLNFETTTEKLLRIVLVGQPQLQKLLLDPGLAQLNQRITLRWHLGPLSFGQTVAYVRHRLTIASGGRAVDVFTRPALRMLHSVSGGVPRLINMIGHRALLTAFVDRQPRVARRAIAKAYREIQTVPLPGTLSVLSRASVAAAGLAFGATLFAIGAPRLDWSAFGVDSVAAPRTAGSRAAETALTVAAAAPMAAASAPSAAVNAPLAVAAGPIAPADASCAAEAAILAPANATIAVAAAAHTAATTRDAARAPAVLTAAELGARVKALDVATSARGSTEALLAGWLGSPLAPDERDLPDGFTTVAWRRGLQSLAFTANVSMLRLLDLPAQLVVRAPGQSAPRFVALTGMTDAQIMLDVDGTSVEVDAATLATVWSGQARVLWRDHDGLGARLGRGDGGGNVMRLQTLLLGYGVFDGRPNGSFDAATEAAVKTFQRAHHLESDGRVGPFTQILLFAAVDRDRPTLDGGARGAS